jgi:hypothetical protein
MTLRIPISMQKDLGGTVKPSESYWTLGERRPLSHPSLLNTMIGGNSGPLPWPKLLNRPNVTNYIPCLVAENGTLHIQLTKAEEAAPWAAAIQGHEVGAQQQQADQKRLMLERFQKEVSIIRREMNCFQDDVELLAVHRARTIGACRGAGRKKSAV